MHILIADDHELFRDGLRELLSTLDDITISEASDREEIEQQLQSSTPADILLLDLDMPGIESLVAVKNICQTYFKVAVLVLSGNDSPHIIDACLNAGVLGFLPKSSDTKTMTEAVLSVYQGNVFIPKQDHIDTSHHIALSPRQSEIFALINEGKPNKEIAFLLGLSESTVKQHITELFRKLQVSNRAQAIKKAHLIQLHTYG